MTDRRTFTEPRRSGKTRVILDLLKAMSESDRSRTKVFTRDGSYITVEQYEWRHRRSQGSDGD